VPEYDLAYSILSDVGLKILGKIRKIVPRL
jgi:hypothetical protein